MCFITRFQLAVKHRSRFIFILRILLLKSYHIGQLLIYFPLFSNCNLENCFRIKLNLKRFIKAVVDQRLFLLLWFLLESHLFYLIIISLTFFRHFFLQDFSYKVFIAIFKEVMFSFFNLVKFAFLTLILLIFSLFLIVIKASFLAIQIFFMLKVAFIWEPLGSLNHSQNLMNILH